MCVFSPSPNHRPIKRVFVSIAGFEVGALDPGNHYVNPKKKTPLRKRCGCNTVIFGLYMACTLCQNSTATYT